MKTLRIQPVDFDEACRFVRDYHRSHKPPVGAKFWMAVGSVEIPVIHGVAIVGRPSARHVDDGWTLEVTRVATDGTPNVCSMLYRSSWKAAQALGYKRLITYTLPEESGSSLRGAGFKCLGKTGGGSWSRILGPRIDTHPLQQKLKWELVTE